MTQRPSTRVLILANLVPVAGVLLLQWDVLTILLLYWAENVIIGVINVFRMICAPLHTFSAPKRIPPGNSCYQLRPYRHFSILPKAPDLQDREEKHGHGDDIHQHQTGGRN